MNHQHRWKETGRRAPHIDGPLFKYGTPVVTYVRCLICQQMGYRKPPSQVVYTWSKD